MQGRLAPEIPRPGLRDAQAYLALPLLVGARLVGVLSVESRDPLCFDEWDEAYLQIVANQIAMGIDHMLDRDDEPEPSPAAPGTRPPVGTRDDRARLGDAPARRRTPRRRRTFVYYRNDDCVFTDGEYLIRNIPGKILWKVLDLHERTGQSECANRELRLDP